MSLAATNVTAPAVQRLGSAVLLQGPALAEVLHLVALGARERERRNGLPASRRLRDLLAVLAETVAEDELVSPLSDRQYACSDMVPRHRDIHERDDSADFDTSVMRRHEISTGEVAEVLGVSQRQVQRLASSIGSRRAPSGRLVFDGLAVQAYAATRKEEREPDA